jgi:hypothetical protein
VVAEAKYAGRHFWAGVLMGMSMGNPKSVSFRCVQCRTTFETTTDRDICLAHRN